MHENINSTNHLFKLFNDSEGVFYTLTPEGEIRLRNLKAEDKDFVQIWDLTSTCKWAKRHLTERKKFYKDAKYPFTLDKVDWQK